MISSKLPGIVDIAKDRVLYADNVEDYKNTIIKLYNNDCLRLDMGKNGRQIVETNYDWARNIERLDQILLDASMM